MKKLMKKKNSGITLIALVITIIVLLILAGISIQMLTGDNGVLKRAGEAKEKTDESQIKETRILATMEAATNVTETTFQGVKIPAGYAPTRIEGESTIDEGLVIVDSIGNEYVWIEVPNDGSGPNYSGVENNNTIDTSKIYTALLDYCEKDKNGNILNSSFGTKYQTEDIWLDRNGKDANSTSDLNDTEICGLTAKEYSDLFDKMLTSVYKNGGFWLGRYEAGTTIIRSNPSDSIEEIQVLSQKDLYPINMVTCKQAQQLSKLVSTNEKYSSSLLFGIQWDLVIKYLNNKGIETKLLNENSGSWGNYLNSSFKIDRGKACKNHNNQFFDFLNLPTTKKESKFAILTTGASENNKKKNIYDFAGNMAELTLEMVKYGNTKVCIYYRGGGAYEDGEKNASQRWCYDYDKMSAFVYGFRISIY